VKVNDGIPDTTEIWSLAINGNYIYAGTNNGIYRRPISEMITSVNEKRIFRQ